MYQIKQLPSDFTVKEISNVNAEINGQYVYFLLKKTNFTTIGALEILSKNFKIPLKNFGFAGNKDKNAVTEQKISIFRGSRNARTKFGTTYGGFENFKFNNIELKYLGNGKKPISLGDLEGNEFFITIRNLDENEIKKIQSIENKTQENQSPKNATHFGNLKTQGFQVFSGPRTSIGFSREIKIPNLYGPQRFSKNNHLVGKAIIKRDFKKAVKLILENNGFIEDKIKQYLNENKNNYIEALRLIPLKTRKLFVHSYQSFLFNKIVSEYLKKNKDKKLENIKIPIIGFNFEIKSIKDITLKNIIKKTIDEEKITSRNFVINQMPELTSEGNFRDLFFELKGLKVLEIDGDELNKSKKKLKINFMLPKSCYATVALEFLFQ